MFKNCYFLVLTGLLLITENSYSIKNGEPTTKFIPLVCFLVFHEEYVCPCYVIHSYYVLAAATCSMNQFYIDVNYLFVSYDSTESESNLNRIPLRKLFPVDYVIAPEGYQPGASLIDRSSYEISIVKTHNSLVRESVTRAFNWNQLPWYTKFTLYSWGYTNDDDTEYPEKLQFATGDLDVNGCSDTGHPFASYMVMCFQLDRNAKVFNMKGNLGALILAGSPQEGDEKSNKLIGIYTGAQYESAQFKYEIMVNVAYYADWIEALIDGKVKLPPVNKQKFVFFPVSGVNSTVPTYKCRPIEKEYHHIRNKKQKDPEDDPTCSTEGDQC
uniref:CSON003979 protein n=1 Tax=Culicoides sonorensis TaxID=179676 RepID=A0A336MMP8_CULSO